VLKWRFDMRYTEEGWLDIVTRYNLRMIMICQEGYTNTLAAAAALHDIEFSNVSYVVGGFQAWKDEGLPVELESQWVYEKP
jgi:3-mercaptopyruvate sulfurtransferase SseA